VLVRTGAAAFPIMVGVAITVGITVDVGVDVALILGVVVSVQPVNAKKTANKAIQDKTLTIFVIILLGWWCIYT
jgi:hypothetical protein